MVPFVKSDEGSAQQTTIPTQSVTSVQDTLETIYIKKLVPYKIKILCVINTTTTPCDESTDPTWEDHIWEEAAALNGDLMEVNNDKPDLPLPVVLRSNSPNLHTKRISKQKV